MIDIHTHILPGVDDGPTDIEESVKIIEQGVRLGIKTFMLTPHIREDSDWAKLDNMRVAYDLLKARFDDRPEIKLVLAAELLLSPALPERVKKNPSIAIYGKYLLVELPFSQLPIYADDVLFRLIVNGYIPILAHPERCLYLQREDALIRRWSNNGVIFQINTGSLYRKYGFRVKWFAKKLIKNGNAQLLGSDIHAPDSSYCSFLKAIETFGKVGDIYRFSQLLVEHQKTRETQMACL